MTTTPSQQSLSLVTQEIKIDGAAIKGSFDTSEIHVYKGVNKIPTAKVVLSHGQMSAEELTFNNDAQFEPGKTISISVGYHSDNKSVFEGVITSHRIRVKGQDIAELILHCSDAAVNMTHVRKSRYFAPSKDDTIKDVDVFNKILGEYGVADSVDSTDSEYEDITQYNCTDWDFVMTRAEMNGKVLVVNDGKVSVVKPDVTASAAMDITYGHGLIKADLNIESRNQLPKTITANAWDFSANEVVSGNAEPPEEYAAGDLTGDKLSEVLAGSEHILHTTVPYVAPDLTTWASARLLKSRLARITGSIIMHGSADLLPNQTLKIKGMSSRLEGDVYVSGVSHHIFESTWQMDVEVGLKEDWFVETQPNIPTPPAAGLIPPIHGLTIGVVKDIHTDPRGEIRVLMDIPMIEPSGKGLWARLSHFYATNEAGLFFMPEIGDEAVLGFLNDDPNFPIILGTMYSNTHVAPYTPDEENTYKAFVTNSKMKIEFEDVKRILTIWTPNENYMIFSDDEGTITIEDENKNKMVMSADGINMYTPKDFVLLADANISIEAGTNIDIVAGANYSCEAGANWDAKASANLTAEASAVATLKGGAQTVVKGGMVMIN